MFSSHKLTYVHQLLGPRGPAGQNGSPGEAGVKGMPVC